MICWNMLFLGLFVGLPGCQGSSQLFASVANTTCRSDMVGIKGKLPVIGMVECDPLNEGISPEIWIALLWNVRAVREPSRWQDRLNFVGWSGWFRILPKSHLACF